MGGVVVLPLWELRSPHRPRGPWRPLDHLLPRRDRSHGPAPVRLLRNDCREDLEHGARRRRILPPRTLDDLRRDDGERRPVRGPRGPWNSHRIRVLAKDPPSLLGATCDLTGWFVRLPDSGFAGLNYRRIRATRVPPTRSALPRFEAITYFAVGGTASGS